MGHSVSCYAPELGIIADKLQKEGIMCYQDVATDLVKSFSFVLEEKVDHDYDVIIANHNHVVEYLRNNFPKTPIISTIHGIIHTDDKGNIAPEHPALNSGVNQFVAVSEEIQGILKEKYQIDSVVIRNFFDISRFENIKAPNPTPKQFLINTNYMGKDDPAIQAIRDASKILDAKVIAIGMNFTQAVDITKALEDADVVFGMGRSVLEGVAAGRLGIVHGRWGTGGAINDANIELLRHYNFSGRDAPNGETSDATELASIIMANYNSSVLEWGKKYMKREHNVLVAAEEYIRLARELRGELITRPAQATLSGVASDTKPFKLAKP